MEALHPLHADSAGCALQRHVVDPFDEVFGSRGSSPERQPHQQQQQQQPERHSPQPSSASQQAAMPQAPLEVRRSLLTDGKVSGL